MNQTNTNQQVALVAECWFGLIQFDYSLILHLVIIG